MGACEERQIAIEQELHGALGEAGRAALAGHLLSCAACRDYRSAAQATEAAMATEARSALAEVDWTRVERGIRRALFRAASGAAAAAIGGALVAALIWLTATPAYRAERMLRTGMALGITAALVALVMALGAWRLSRLERGEEMVRIWRETVRAEVRFGRWLPAVLLPLLGWMLWRAATAPSDRVDAPLFYGACAALLAAAGLYSWLVKLPRALREQAELERRG